MDQKPEVKIEPEGEDKKTGKTRSQPRFRIAAGLALALLLVTCAVAAGGLMTYFRGKCGRKFTIKASVNGQTFTEEVEVDRENGMVVYRDDVSTEDGEIIQTKEGLSVLYQRGLCYLLEDKNNNQTSEFDIDAAELAMESLSNAGDVPSFDVDRVVFLNRSVPVSPEDDVILRPQLPPVCRDAPLYRAQEEDARVHTTVITPCRRSDATDLKEAIMDQKPEVKIDPEDKKTGKTRSQPRFRLAMVLAVALLLVTCAVAAGGLRMYYGGKCGHKFTINATVNGQTFTEEVEVDRENGMVVYRDDVSTEDGEIIQTKEGWTVLHRLGSCFLLDNRKNNQTSDIDAVEAALKSLANDDDVPSLDVDRVVFLNRSVPVSPEDDVILRPQLPPVCRDAPLYRVQEEDARVFFQLRV
ncbi:Hypp8962 [Branchiostoma lanceolatum]|uniref:Hypp8962 protein n=1 Tax=Branchiostoma lanceolatum TaxID=7740 RepID=A0A8J9ZC76_BRALA|nr:Hypp8962 [Branchiostoma lanceolatum]